jgi:hypothetical protein
MNTLETVKKENDNSSMDSSPFNVKKIRNTSQVKSIKSKSNLSLETHG